MAVQYLNYLKVEDNLANQATLAAVDPDDDTIVMVDSNFPISNVQDLPLAKVGRVLNVTTSDHEMKIQIIFPVATGIDTIALINHNLSSDATIEFRGGASLDPTSSMGAVTWRRNNLFRHYSSTQTYKYYCISVVDTANIHGFFQLGYLIMGNLSSISVGHAYGSEFRDEVVGFEADTETGNPLDTTLAERTRMSLHFRNKPNSDIDTLRSLFLDNFGDNIPALFIPDTSGSNCVFGRFHRNSFNRTYSAVSLSNVSLDIIDDITSPIAVDGNMIAEPHRVPTNLICTRSGTALYKNGDLRLAEAAANEFRNSNWFARDRCGMIIEWARTNGWTYSEDIDESVWIKTNCTVNNGGDSDKIDEPRAEPNVVGDLWEETVDGSPQTHSIYRTVPSPTDNTAQSWSGFFKADSRYRIVVQTITQAGSTWNTTFNFNTGTIVSQSGNHEVILEEYFGGWYRCMISFDSESGGTPCAVTVFMDNGSATTYTGDGSGMYCFGFQIEVDKIFPSSYIATGAATATRQQDRVKVPFNRDTQSLTLYIKRTVTDLEITGSRSMYTATIGDSSAPCIEMAVRAANGATRFIYNDGTTSYNADATTAVSLEDEIETVGTIYPDGDTKIEVKINGGSSETDTTTGAKIGLPLTAGSEYLYLALRELEDGSEYVSCLNSVKVALGVHDLDYMRKL